MTSDGVSAQLAIVGGRIVDQHGERRGTVLIEGDRISAVGDDVVAEDTAFVLDATRCTVAPGFVDLHAHLRQPGREDAETIESGSRAAALGGYTAVVAMPNTDPAADTRGVVEFVREEARRAGASRSAAVGSSWPRSASSLPPECDCSPTTAPVSKIRC
jgi:dihydroorotase